MDSSYSLSTPEETAAHLAEKIRTLRLARKWKQATLAQHAGVSLASLRRFEHSGQISMQHFLRLVFALGHLQDFDDLFQPPKASSIAELEKTTSSIRKPQRGSV
jgi:transcriptional regulator with XRE-family HTH domain